MLKNNIALTLIIFILLFLGSTGQLSADMVCKVSTPAIETCTPYLLLESADINISGQDSFDFKGRYTACFQVEDVTIKGRVKRFSFHDGIDLELLATEIQTSPNIFHDFPRTIGTITLKETPLEGYFFDTWATIRTRGVYQQEPFSKIIHCKQGKVTAEESSLRNISAPGKAPPETEP